MAERLPSTKPSSSAYIGAVTGAQDFLNIVTMATMNPPIAPIAVRGSTVSAVGAWVNRFHVQAAVATAQTTRIPVLFTVPDRVICSPMPTPSAWKLLRFNAGFEVLISAIFAPQREVCRYECETHNDTLRAKFAQADRFSTASAD